MQLSLARSAELEKLFYGVDRLRQNVFRLFMEFEDRMEQRRQRRALRRLDTAMLRDLGLSAADVEGEASKSF